LNDEGASATSFRLRVSWEYPEATSPFVRVFLSNVPLTREYAASQRNICSIYYNFNNRISCSEKGSYSRSTFSGKYLSRIERTRIGFLFWSGMAMRGLKLLLNSRKRIFASSGS